MDNNIYTSFKGISCLFVVFNLCLAIAMRWLFSSGNRSSIFRSLWFFIVRSSVSARHFIVIVLFLVNRRDISPKNAPSSKIAIRLLESLAKTPIRPLLIIKNSSAFSPARNMVSPAAENFGLMHLLLILFLLLAFKLRKYKKTIKKWFM